MEEAARLFDSAESHTADGRPRSAVFCVTVQPMSVASVL